MNKLMRRTCAVLLTIIFLSSTFVNTSFAAELTAVDMAFDSVKSDKDASIAAGQKGINFNPAYIAMDIDNSFELPDQSLLSGIKVTANGAYDETDKFTITYSSGALKLTVKNSGSGYLKPYELIKHAVYNIYIPQGTCKSLDGTKVNKAINYLFVTGTDQDNYPNDIIKKVTPSDSAINVDNKSGKIEIEFIAEIGADTAALATGASICAQSLTYPEIENTTDSIGNYNISISGSKLIFQSKSGKFKDFAKYTLTLPKNTVCLKNYPALKNDDQTFSFTTNNFIESTSPTNNQEGVGVKPVISFNFKYPVELIDPSKIIFSSDADQFSVTSAGVKLSSDLKMLTINTNGANTLRKSTLYRVTMQQGSVAIATPPGIVLTPSAVKVLNDDISLFFITTSDGQSPVVTGYSSDTAKSDDITSLQSTKLDSSGSIYVHFDRAICENKLDPSLTLLNATKLYKVPKASATDYDPYGRIFDERLSFYPATINQVQKILPTPAAILMPNLLDGIEDTRNMEEIPVSKVEIAGTNILKITPGYPLLNHEKYKITIDNRIIDDLNGYSVSKGIEFAFWTKAASLVVSPVWKGISQSDAQSISENTLLPYKSYTLYGVPRYEAYDPNSPVKHIIINVDSEIIPAVKDDTVQQTPEVLKRISFDSLNNISLTDVSTSAAIGFSRYELQYYYENGVKKTRVHLYPAKTLDSGKSYRMSIASGVFESRSGNALGAIEVNFTVEGNAADVKGINDISPNEFLAAEIKSKGEMSFAISGYNFIENIAGITLTPLSGNASAYSPIDISPSAIRFENVTKLSVKIDGSTALMLGSESRTGDYQVSVRFNDSMSTVCISPENIKILSKGKPQVIDKYPYSSGGAAWFDENNINPQVIDGTKVYFMRVTFRDYDNTLAFNDTLGLSILRDACTVNVAGSGASMIDTDFLNRIIGMADVNRKSYISNYIFKKDITKREAYLYVPIKLLRSQTTYAVNIMPDIVYFEDGTISQSSNDSISWTFTTMTTPIIREISLGSVPEYYDEDIPLILTGDLFQSGSTRVLFGGREASSVTVKTDSDGNKYLEVYLPHDSRLDVGIYDIYVQNDSNHRKVLYGTLSVVGEGDDVPKEGIRIKDRNSKGVVVSTVKTSLDTIELKEEYNNDSSVELDMDKLMGEEVLVRKIKIQGRSGNRISQLETTSRWSDIDIYDLTVATGSEDDEIMLSLGRVEPGVVKSIRAKLKGVVKSDFIQVTGSNFTFTKAVLNIPIKNVSESSVKAMRYDEETRNWYVESCSMDLINMTAQIQSKKPGIYVVVQ